MYHGPVTRFAMFLQTNARTIFQGFIVACIGGVVGGLITGVATGIDDIRGEGDLHGE